ncbi:hypothetical protein K431DRAFT_288682 [Polychaeton citri CBS 116435]|uniref:Pentatricopeptide repeat protein n=1 Tax=Polychaeton citri CBS 116435 TaxID=1314669 RepID=A0A9P4ULU1_9PEZI|nr:hypothetical protein K431DRAFT_288682 [Polychaeton citri CBS 116435]
MPGPFVCATCRLRTAVSRLRQQRLPSARYPTELSQTPCGGAVWQNQATSRVDGRQHMVRRYSSGDAPVGRYSRRTLRPQEVLEQLGPTGQDIRGRRNDIRYQQPRLVRSSVRRPVASDVCSSRTLSGRLAPLITSLDEALARKDITTILRSLQSIETLQKSNALSSTDLDGFVKSFDAQKKMAVIEAAIQARSVCGPSANENEAPTIAMILKALQDLGALDRVTLLRTLRVLAHTIAAGRIRRLKEGTPGDVAVYPPVSPDCENELMSNLVEAWRQYIQARVSVRSTETSSRSGGGHGEIVDHMHNTSDVGISDDWDFLPDIAALKSSSREDELTVVKALCMIFGERSVHKTSIRETLLVTHDLLTQQTAEFPPQPLSETYTATQHLKGLFESIVRLPGGFGELNFGRTPRTDRYFEEYLQAMAARLNLTLPDKPDQMQSKLARQSQKLVEELPELDNNQHDELIKRIGRAVERSDNSALERLFRAFRQQQPDITGERPSMLRYEGLILAFLTLRHPSRAVDVWNLMLKAGLSPTTRTWTIMLNGCQRANDTNAMEGFWRRMRMDGFQPDQHAWSTRILGLMSGRRIEQGLAAMAEMGQEWVNAAKAAKYETLKAKAIAAAASGKKEKMPSITQVQISAEEYPEDVNGIPRPDIVVMNTAVSALATKDDKHIHKVLQWGQAFGIEPNVQTYNALLNVTMRHGNPDEAISILQRMQQKGHGLNSSTFTVILTALFESDEFLKGVPVEQQEQDVLNVIRGLESVGHSKVDAKGYAVIFDRLLKRHNNPDACRAVMAYMQDQGIEPGTHIYTILMAHYFNCNPPHLEAIDSLWAHIKSAKRGYGIALDNIFYDRMVEGYATHHGIVGVGPMFRFLQEMTTQGKTPSWYVLRLVAQALAEREEWTRLGHIVHDIRQQGRGGKGGLKMKGMAGQRDFWSFIISTGVLEKEGITHPSQVEVFRDDNFSAAAGKAEITASRAARGLHV